MELSNTIERKAFELQLSNEYNSIMGSSDWSLQLERIKEINKQIERIWLYESRNGYDPFMLSFFYPMIKEWKNAQKNF